MDGSMTTMMNNITVSQLYQKARETYGFPVVGITGSNGKTTTKAMLSVILRRAGSVLEFPDHADTPERISAVLKDIKPVDWIVTKVGAHQTGHVADIASFLQPDLGIITNIGEAHLAQHGSMEKIALEKQALLDVLDPRKGIAILNGDNEFTRQMAKSVRCRTRLFGLSEHSDYYASNWDYLGPDGMAITVQRKRAASLRLHLPIYSIGDVYNLLAAISAADSLGISDAMISDALENDFILPKGRGRLITQNGLKILDDTHDSTPQSLLKSSKSLINFRPYSDRLFLIMGDMTELGNQAEQLHRMTGHYLAAMPIDYYFMVGKFAPTVAQALSIRIKDPHRVKAFATVSDVIDHLTGLIQKNDTLLIEGGENLQMSEIVNVLCHENSDRKKI
jgi:UDP-N-acetylmuramoyl-tripeptide--D-alanyl-D-alanine ligase